MAVDAINGAVVSRIRQIRIAKRLRVQDLAERAGIPLGSYSCLDTGRYRMSLENLFRALTVLETDITEVWPRGGGEVESVSRDYIERAAADFRSQAPRQVSYRDILKAVCGIYKTSRKKLSSPSRRRDLAEARTVATILFKEQRHLTLAGLSRILKRDVSTLSHCLRRLDYRLEHDEHLRVRISDSRRRLIGAFK